MRVVMKTQISGTRDGAKWPAPGEPLEVSDGEAASLVAAGLAETAQAPQNAAPVTETADAAPEGEKAVAAPQKAAPRKRAPRKATA